MTLVDTPVWSLALRRRAADLSPSDRRLTQTLCQLIREGRVQLLGATRQEILSRIREEPQFRRICDYLRDFPNVGLDAADYEQAALINNQCRSAGVAATAVDMLMCAVSLRHSWEIFTTDRDFIHYARVVPLRLLHPS